MNQEDNDIKEALAKLICVGDQISIKFHGVITHELDMKITSINDDCVYASSFESHPDIYKIKKDLIDIDSNLELTVESRNVRINE